MSAIALTLVIAAAFIHASWNMLAKHVAGSGFGGQSFVFLTALVTSIVYLPVAAYAAFTHPIHLGYQEWLAVGISAVVHYLYALFLQRAYQEADISVVYPVVRGAAPLLAMAGACLFLGESLAWTTAAGALLIVGGMLILAKVDKLLSGSATRKRMAVSRPATGIGLGLVTASFLALYTVWDGYLVKVMHVSPFIVDYVGNILRVVFLLPVVATSSMQSKLSESWRRHKMEIIAVGSIASLSYILVLFAMRIAPVSSVAPAREISMMIVACLGMKIFKEGDAPRRLLASAVMVAGVLAIGLR